jgi:uncharacterized protein YdcH (DUF465 family)
MSHVAHELHDEFPEHSARIHALKMANMHFARIADRYHEINRAIHRAETEVEPVGDDELELMKKQCLHLKDEIAAMLWA